MASKPITNITGDRYTDFVLANWDDVQALQSSIYHAQDFLPEWLKRQTVTAVLDMDDGYFQANAIECEVEDDEEYLWWCTKEYDRESEVGPYFQFDYAECNDVWKCLDSSDARSCPSIAFYVDLSGGKRASAREMEQWRGALARKRNSHYSVVANPEYEDGYVLLAEYAMDDVFTIKNIRDPGKLRRAVQSSVSEFLELLRPVITSRIRATK
jgi:hypothetical protein